ncbi:MAG: glycogen/starch/alpha-glucan phosphorylase [Candidatus Omnitrophica bacterium]|nr:glycogen/starch/alpha-glucan phosphorylase [Candidatus Omnitrophota bacterium]
MSKKKTSKEPWVLVHKDMTKEGMKTSFRSSLFYRLAKDAGSTTHHDDFMALSMAVRDRIVERWISTQQNFEKENPKRVYYLSLEFLIGRLLSNNLLNLNLVSSAREALKDLGIDPEQILQEEPDAGLGNGGLGRLAACFLDSMATLGIPGDGYGIRYDYGIFNQRIVEGYQVESPDEWLKQGNPWEFARPEYAVNVKFYGDTYMFHDRSGKLCVEWQNTQNILAMPYDIPVPGYQNNVVNTLRLWSARASEEFDLEYFNHGDYEKAVFNKMFSENISKVLYPNDANSMGRELRLKQEYFFTAASIADILRRFKAENSDLRDLPEKVAIQLNDTHPALAVVEFMRILLDEEQLDWETAWDMTVRTFAYTNHTVMPEALECWAVPLFEKLLPRHMQLIYEINARFLREVANRYPGDTARLKRMSIIEEASPKRIRMAYLAIVGSHSVNGVSELHSSLLTSDLFRDFYEVYPRKFNNKTNGITQRRWLKAANPDLSSHIESAIGSRWVTDLYELEKLTPLKDDRAFQQRWREIKQANKVRLAGVIEEIAGVRVNPNSLFDVQVKRIHEYKRQILFAFYVIAEYLKIKENPQAARVPRTCIFAGKAAPGYSMAKMIIKFINSAADVINHDKSVGDLLKVVFLENYRVSLAESIFPASDLSEQISTAGTEASGTGCMKFMVNGALTVGTWDGANIEMAEAVGEENIFTFGLKASEVADLKSRGYDPQGWIRQSPMLEQIFKMIESGFFSPVDPGAFSGIVHNLRHYDPYLVCADFEDYCRVQNTITEQYLKPDEWTAKSILNTARSGKFSSDRTITEYAREIWGIPFSVSKPR